MMRPLPAVALCAAGALACAPDPIAATAEGDAGGPAVLFIGNSLTEANGLAARVASIARTAGRPLRTDAVTMSGASLADHWQDGRALAAIRKGGWSVVALQQGPSTLPESRAELIASTRQFAAEIRRAGARPALLMVWPLPGQAAEAVSASYRAAAEANEAILLPAGDAWVLAAAGDPSLVLVQADGFHPSAIGTELAAIAVECTLFPEDHGALATSGASPLLVEAGCSAASCAAASGSATTGRR